MVARTFGGASVTIGHGRPVAGLTDGPSAFSPPAATCVLGSRPMSGALIECSNCGHGNPSWAQVCRSCGAPILPEADREARSKAIFPTDQSSIVSMGVTIGAILLAIVVGLFASGIVPAAPIVAAATPTPSPSPSASAGASASAAPSGSVDASASGGPQLIGDITYGLVLDATTHEVSQLTDTFTSGTRFCYSIQLTDPFGVSTINEEIARVESDGTFTIVQGRNSDAGTLKVDAGLTIAGYSFSTNPMLRSWGAGTYVMREYRGDELIAESQFILAS